jgi:hypothetical protein
MTTPNVPQGHFPRCPSRDRFPVITGFITPGSDFPPPHPLDASISLDVFDPTEFISAGQYERIRVVETDDDFLIEVNWCVCGAFAASLAGCWELNFYLDDVDGGADADRSNGPVGSTQTVDVDSVQPVPVGTDDDITRRCYTYSFTVPAGTVKAGAYSLLAVITLRTGRCSDPRPGRQLGDYLGFAQIPVLVFVPGE